ncbi:MAG TPA: S8 family peptidase [Actinomycetota bacterium]|nr:S8 family peptidase [Actinomycetota bacterium]
MKASRASVAAALAALVAAAAALTAPASARPASSSSDGYIVVLADSARAGAVADAHAQRFGADVGFVYRHALKGYSARMSDRAAQRVAAAPNVLWVERDKPMETTAQTLPTGVDRVDAELSPTARIDGVDERVNADVAVIDTGIDLDHPDLNVHRAGGKNCDNPLLAPDDDNGHGTHVAGTIGALDNTIGVVGVAPGARVWPVKVLGASGVGLTSSVICGIDYVTANASSIEVANMSLGGGGSDDRNCGNSNNDAMHRAICRSVGAGVTYAVAAGNSSADASTSTPAAYDEVITVSALADFNGKPGGGAAPTCRNDVDDTFANFSNYGADVDIIAPGVCILSTYMLGGYSTLSGTSMASPHVAGGAALYKATHPTATPAQVKSALQSSGSSDWNNADDRDNIKEPLLSVATY